MSVYYGYLPPCGMFCGNCKWLTNEKKPCSGAEIFCKARPCSFVKCTEKKGIKYCIDCDKFPCANMRRHMERVKRVYGQDMVAQMRMIKELGEEAYLKKMNEGADKE